MKSRIIFGIICVIVSLLISAYLLSNTTNTVEIEIEEIIVHDYRQEVWISALEWCESSGINITINPQDNDGTPSYGAFQFKPKTFIGFLKKYNLKEADLMDYETQRELVRRMINDPDVKIETQFPNCVKNKIGYPPKKPFN